MKEQQFTGRFPMKSGTCIDVSVPVILYEEEGIYYAYCAALDILGYDDTEDGARRSFEIMLEDTLDYAASNGTISALLESCGWHKNEPPKTSDLVTRNRELADIMDNKAYKTIRESVKIPCA